MMTTYPRLGALPGPRGVSFNIWAPSATTVEVVFEDDSSSLRLTPEGGYHTGIAVDAKAGMRYRLRVNGDALYPDPYSRFQPEGVHGPSAIVDPNRYDWRDASWKGRSQSELVFYELHVGTFTPEGTYASAAARLPYLKELGITAVELMPVADFPGNRNWGYDPAAFYAPSRSYGSPDELRALVDEAHALGLAVFLDVIYNHLGPDGAYVAALAPMFTERHHTPWGAAINLDDEGSDGVRAFFIDNALHWLREYHIDGLRLDATHALIDDTEPHFLAELSAVVGRLEGPTRYLIAEDPRNINRVITPLERDGYGIDGIWTDDFHHQIRNMTAGDREGYYADYDPTSMVDLAETIRNGWYYDGRPSRITGEARGTPADDVRHEQCVICIQNHDQVGNRPLGNRLTDQVDSAVYRAVSSILLFMPHLPLLFMGQEWASTSPFLFFTDHNEELGEAVTKGRREEFASFSEFSGTVPDPQSLETYTRSRLRWEELDQPEHASILALYRALLQLRPSLGGSLSCTPFGSMAIGIERGPHMLLATLGHVTALPFPSDYRILLSTEDASFSTDAQPIERDEDAISFRRAGAVIAINERY